MVLDKTRCATMIVAQAECHDEIHRFTAFSPDFAINDEIVTAITNSFLTFGSKISPLVVTIQPFCPAKMLSQIIECCKTFPFVNPITSFNTFVQRVFVVTQRVNFFGEMSIRTWFAIKIEPIMDDTGNGGLILSDFLDGSRCSPLDNASP